MTSYISLLNKIEAFCNAHLQIKKYKGEFKEQMPNFSTMNEKYPIVFIVPTSDSETLELNQFTLDIYCVDIIQKDRANLNTIVSDCHLILKDLYLYFKDGSDLSVDVIADPTMTPLNNFDLDYVAGWVMTITFEVEGYSICAIPMNPIPPFTPTCEDATVENSDESYTATVASGGTLVLPDITVTDSDGSISSFPSAKNVTCTPSPDTDIEVNGVAEGTVSAGATVDVITNIVPASSSLVGNNLTLTFTKELFWELNFNGTDDVIFIPATVNNVGTLASGSGSNVGTITVSTDGITYGALSFPFTPVAATTYYFKRSTFTVTGAYTMTGTYA